MPHINLPEGLPGITSGFAFRPETAPPLLELAEVLLRGPSSHRAAAAHHLQGNYDLVDAVRWDYQNAPVTPKLKALLAIAAKVQQGGKNVPEEDIAVAREAGATDLELHDTVLIAAAFCMYNRYVDGLATWTPEEPRLYHQMGAQMANQGYLRHRG